MKTRNLPSSSAISDHGPGGKPAPDRHRQSPRPDTADPFSPHSCQRRPVPGARRPDGDAGRTGTASATTTPPGLQRSPAIWLSGAGTEARRSGSPFRGRSRPGRGGLLAGGPGREQFACGEPVPRDAGAAGPVTGTGPGGGDAAGHTGRSFSASYARPSPKSRSITPAITRGLPHRYHPPETMPNPPGMRPGPARAAAGRRPASEGGGPPEPHRKIATLAPLTAAAG